MESSRAALNSETRTSKPSLAIPGGGRKPPKPMITMQRDQQVDQWQIKRVGGDPCVSTLSFDHWNAVHSVPSEFIDAQFPPSPDSTTRPEALWQVQPRKLSRFTAWIKRSGKGLVLRLRRSSNKSTVDFTDVHLLGAELCAQEPAVHELSGTVDIMELESPLSPGHNAMSRTRAELPGRPLVYELPEDHALVSRSELLGSDVQEFDAWERSYMRSPSGTIDTSFSLADTAVGSIEDESGEQVESPSGVSQAIEGGLIVSKSIRYRCAAHQDFEPASPNEVVRLMAGRSYTSISGTVLGSKPDDPVPHHTITKSNDQHSLMVKCRKSMPGDSDRELVITPSGHGPPIRAMYGMTTLVLQQDLHMSKTLVMGQTFSAHLSSTPSYNCENLASVKALLGGLSPPKGPGREFNLPIIDLQRTRGEQGRPQYASDGLGTKHEKGTLAGHRSSSRLSVRTPEQLDDDPTTTAHDGGSGTLSSHGVVSPLTPLGEGDTYRHSSAASHLAPITPLTPVRSVVVPLGGTRDDNTPPTPDDGATDENELLKRAGSKRSQQTERSPLSERAGEKGTSVAEQRPPIQPDADEADEATKSAIEEAPLPDSGIKHLADFVDYQQSPSAAKEMPDVPAWVLFDDKIPARYKNTRFNANLQIDTSVADRSQPQVMPLDNDLSPVDQDTFQDTGRTLPATRGALRDTVATVVSGVTSAVIRSALWMQRHAGQEPPVPDGHVRVRWTCSCGLHLFDDFRELRPGAASRLEAVLNKHAPHPYGTPNGNGRGSQSSMSHTPGSSAHYSSSATSWSNGSAGYGPPSGYPFKGTPRSSRTSSYQMFPPPPQRYLLTCINEARNTPKVFNLPLHERPVSTDAQLADALQHHYFKVNAPWYRWLRLRGLTSIEFVQFYMHKNRFADIRMRPSVPLGGLAQGYEFNATDTLPPVGGQYLLHLFKHPHEYDSETVAILSIPKKTERLHYGIGWGIVLTEGFLPERIWLLIFFTLILFACVFGVVWAVKKDDVQGAFGVASFMTSLASVMVGFAQACLG